MFKSHSCVWSVLSFETSWTVAHQVPLSLELSRQKYWSELPFPTPGDLPDPGNKLMSLASPALAGKFFTTVPPGRPLKAISLRIMMERHWREGALEVNSNEAMHIRKCSLWWEKPHHTDRRETMAEGPRVSSACGLQFCVRLALLRLILYMTASTNSSKGCWKSCPWRNFYCKKEQIPHAR